MSEKSLHLKTESITPDRLLLEEVKVKPELFWKVISAYLICRTMRYRIKKATSRKKNQCRKEKAMYATIRT